MKNNLSTYSRVLSLKSILSLVLLANIFGLPVAFAANVLLANKPLVDSTTSDVLPNLMFILDNSGSMAQDYTPDWANSVNSTLYDNSSYNTQFYNPKISYQPAVDYIGTTLGSQTTWTSVKNNAFRAADGVVNLVGASNYYAYVPGEYCTAQDLTNCIATSAPTTIYPYPATVRWCDTTANAAIALPLMPAVGKCEAIKKTGFTNLRTPASTSTVTFAVASNTYVSSITINGKEILANTTATTNNTSTMAANVKASINACTNAVTGNCQLAGFSASVAGSVVTITSPYGGTALPIVTKAGLMTAVPTALVQVRPGSLVYVDIAGISSTYTAPGSATKSPDRTDCAGTVCSYAEEMTNYANWWTYYRTRMQGMKSAASLAFKSIDNRYRVGFYTINNSATNYLPIAKFELGVGKQKQLWYNKLFSIVPGSGTPLRSALTTVGQIYAGKKPIGTADPIEYACQPNFTLLTTDGYWNTDADSDVKSVTGGTIGDMDGGTTDRPLYEGPTASSASLADAAKYYYDTDIRTSAFGNCVGSLGQNVCGDGASEVTFKKQKMTTLTLGLGIDGTLQYAGDYKTQTTGDFAGIKSGSKNWPVAVANTETAIDDLWHAAVNANGTYFSARDPKQLTEALKKALLDIQSKVGAGSAASASSLQPTAGDNFNYVASYSTVKWTGNLEARTVNLTTFETSKDATWCVENVAADSCAAPANLVSEVVGSSNVFYCKTTGSNSTACGDLGGVLTGTDCRVEVATSCVGKLASQVVTPSGRNILFNSGGTLTSFNYGALNSTQKTYFEKTWLSNSLSQWVGLSTAQQALAEKDGIVSYLRGQQGLENRPNNTADNRIFRYREATLGDITESQPAFIAEPLFKYADAGFDAFKTAQSTRTGVIYVGANDGMLHAFQASTGLELWAFVPTPVIPNMWKLADENYATNHVNFVNGDPVIGEVCVSACTSTGAVWKTVLVGGLSGGGRGYYALDITDPNSPALLWEYTSVNNSNLGYTFGAPVITKLNDGTWVALLTSGYNNGSKDNDGITSNSPTGDGQGRLFVLDFAASSNKTALKTFNTYIGTAATPSGLAPVASFVDKVTKNNLATHVYGGDLQGNLWRFDINAASGSAPFKLATLVGPDGVTPQSITTVPQLGVINKQRVIFVGTGKYLELADLSNTETQTIYAIKDANLSTPLGNPRPSLVPQIISTSGTSRSVTTAAAVDFNTGLGWRVDLPDAGERVNIDPLLVNGALLAPTIVPSSTSCSPGGYGWFNYFNYKTGGALPNLAGVISEKLNSPAVGFNLVYDADGKPVITVVESDGPTPHLIENSEAAGNGGGGTRATLFSKNLDGTYGTKSIWRELTK
jgi:type IV pilus assembly protein PilY1